jgi:hypothetical protein
MAVEKRAVADAFDRLHAFLSDGEAVVTGKEVTELGDALKTVADWSRGLKQCLDACQCPAKITQVESPSGLMVDKDTPGPAFLEFKSEYQAP